MCVCVCETMSNSQLTVYVGGCGICIFSAAQICQMTIIACVVLFFWSTLSVCECIYDHSFACTFQLRFWLSWIIPKSHFQFDLQAIYGSSEVKLSLTGVGFLFEIYIKSRTNINSLFGNKTEWICGRETVLFMYILQMSSKKAIIFGNHSLPT